MPAEKSFTVTLGPQQRIVEELLSSGAYADVSDVMRAGLRALERQRAALERALDSRIRLALDDPRPSVAANEVFDAIERRHARLTDERDL